MVWMARKIDLSRIIATIMRHNAILAAVFLIPTMIGGIALAENKFEKPQDQPLFMSTKKGDPEFAKTESEARRTISVFRLLIARGTPNNMPLVKKRFVRKSERILLWLRVTKVETSGFVAETFEAPPEFPELKTGTKLFIKDSEVSDWMLDDNGTLHGGYSIRLQRSKLPEEQRASFDKFIGAERYAPLPP